MMHVPSTQAGEPFLRSLFDAALEASSPAGKFYGRLPHVPRGRTIVLGAGKAAGSMAAAFEAAWPGRCEGLVVTRYGHGARTRYVEVVEAGHPVPDTAGLRAAERILELARDADEDDLVVVLISGGASALLSVPAPGVTLADKRDVNRALLRSGARIADMNAVRRAISGIKGGKLAAAAFPARVVTFVISDVPGDDPAVVGSGPTVPVVVDVKAVRGILEANGIVASPGVVAAIESNAGAVACGPVDIHVIARPLDALEAAADEARRHGVEPIILGDAIEGEASELGREHARLALAAAHERRSPVVFLSGGETTVTVRSEGGRGGRNTEYLLSLAIALEGHPDIRAIACDTDGIDGSQDNAGAWIDAAFWNQANENGLNLQAFLNGNDSYGAFEALGRLVVTGPTLTNVNDFRAILVNSGAGR